MQEFRGVLIAGSVTALGWLVTHVLTVWREDVNRSREALLNHTARQLEELYGPLVFQVYEGRRTWVGGAYGSPWQKERIPRRYSAARC